MKTFLLILLCLFGLIPSKPFEVIKSTKQTSNGGRAESGITTSYSFKILAYTDSKKLKFEDLWIDSTYFQAVAYKQNSDLSFSNDFSKGDSIYIKAAKRKIPNGSGELIEEENIGKNLPYKYQGKALIGYSLKGKKKYFAIEEIEDLPVIYMQ
ncbi:MAG: hypothetical protein AUJ98_05655 [Bacteroidetes bacterium CG2_30_33_31]|nr:MAG: hypothetical protein AUJ98_05655 [Bacteroidetes bacterium CG2_30_33_31]